MFSLAEAEDGPTITAMRELSKKLSIVMIAPIFEVDGDDYFNTAFVLGPEGEMIGKYRKIHVPQIPLWEEGTYFQTGDLGFPGIRYPLRAHWRPALLGYVFSPRVLGYSP